MGMAIMPCQIKQDDVLTAFRMVHGLVRGGLVIEAVEKRDIS
jgi:hypothetical protein